MPQVMFIFATSDAFAYGCTQVIDMDGDPSPKTSLSLSSYEMR